MDLPRSETVSMTQDTVQVLIGPPGPNNKIQSKSCLEAGCNVCNLVKMINYKIVNFFFFKTVMSSPLHNAHIVQ